MSMRKYTPGSDTGAPQPLGVIRGALLLYKGIKPMLLKQPVELGVKRMARGLGQGMVRHPDLLLLTFPAFAHRHYRPPLEAARFLDLYKSRKGPVRRAIV